MSSPLQTLSAFSGLAFLSYGLLCVFSEHMKSEFERYGLSRYRRLVGVLEVAGGAGVLLGLLWIPLLVFSASGLSLLMLLGLLVRLRLNDPWLQMAPAAVLLFVNALLAWRAASIIP